MKRTTWIGAFAVVVVLAASAGSAQALYVFSEDEGTVATHVLWQQECVTRGQWHKWLTYATSEPWADPVMHLLRWESAAGWVEVAYDDDSSPYDNNNPQIQFYAPTNKSCWYAVVVRAYDNASGGSGGGTYRYYRDRGSGWVYVGTYNLGGYIVDPSTDVTTSETMESVLVNDGAPATYMYRFQYQTDHQAFSARDFNYGGVGLASKMWGGPSSNEQWVIATPVPSTREGPVRVLRNDYTTDDDGDGLGGALEDALCTCNAVTGIRCGFDCSTAPSRQDTDGDGLTDYAEAIGVDDSSNPQLLYLWGASPVRKDIFVEIDLGAWPGQSATAPSQAILESTAGAYSQLDLVSNPDGTTGVAAHFDRGVDCTEPGDADGITGVCGDFGGSSLVTTDPGGTRLGGWSANMASLRVTLFHWVIVISGASGGQGQTPGMAVWVQNNTSAGILAQELGHNLGIFHWGEDAAGKTNRKPHYKSLMNYAYQETQPPRFSDGGRDPLNPQSLSETTDYSPGADISFLGWSSHYDFDFDSGNPQRVDWNRDGQFDPSVRAYIHGQPRRRDWGGRDVPAAHERENLPDATTNIGPAAVYFRHFVLNSGIQDAKWVIVHNATTDRFQYNFSAFQTGGWTNWTDLGTQTFRADSEPSAAVFPVSGADRLAVLGVDTSDRVAYSTWDEYGSGSAWSTLDPPVGVTFKDVAAAAVGDRLYLVGRDVVAGATEGELWFGYFDAAWIWSGWTQAFSGGNPAKSLDFTPGIAEGPDGKLYVLVKSADSSSARWRDLDMYVVDPLTGSWSLKLATEWRDVATNCKVDGRPGIAFAPHRDAAGNPLTSGNGALWMWWHVKHKTPGQICGHAAGPLQTFHRWTWGALSAAAQAFDVGKWHYIPLINAGSFCHTDEIDGAGSAVVASNDGVEAVMPHVGSPSCPNGLIHLPYADGQAPVILSDFDDHAAIDANLCSSLNYVNNTTCRCNSVFDALCSETNPPPEEPINDNEENPAP